MEVGARVYSPFYGDGVVIKNNKKCEDHHFCVKFTNEIESKVFPRSALGDKLFLDPIKSNQANRDVKLEKIKTTSQLKIEEQFAANEILLPLKEIRDEYKYLYHNRTAKGMIEGFVTEEYIKRTLPMLEQKVQSPFNYSIEFQDNSGQIYQNYVGVNDITHSDKQWVQSIKSKFYSELVMQSRLGKSEVEIDSQLYQMKRKRDIKFTGNEGVVKSVTEIKYDAFTDYLFNQNADEYLIKSLSEDELFQSRLNANSTELQEIFLTMTQTQHEIATAPITHPIIVQGGAGTGKTSVGMHRIAYLLYNDMIEKAIAVGPSDYFATYIEKSLQQLGVYEKEEVSCVSRHIFYTNLLQKLIAELKNYTENKEILKSWRQINHNISEKACISDEQQFLKDIQNEIHVLKSDFLFEIKKCISGINILCNEDSQYQNQLTIKNSIIELIKYFEDAQNELTKKIKRILIDVNAYEELKSIHEEKTTKLTTKKLRLQEIKNDNQTKWDERLKIEEQIERLMVQRSEIENEKVDILKNIEPLQDKKNQCVENILKLESEYHELEQLTKEVGFFKRFNLKRELSVLANSLNEQRIELSKIETNLYGVNNEIQTLDKRLQQQVSRQDELTKKIELIDIQLDKFADYEEEVLKKMHSLELELAKNLKTLSRKPELIESNKKFKAFLIERELKSSDDILAELTKSETYVNDLIAGCTLECFIKLNAGSIDVVGAIHLCVSLFPECQSVINTFANTYFFVDEAQDLSQLELQVISSVAENRLTLVGDVNQNIFDSGYYEWDRLINTFGADFYTLDYNWRSTKQIVKEASEYLIQDKYKNVGIVSGKAIKEITYAQKSNVDLYFSMKWYEELIQSLRKNKQAAVIAIDEKQFIFLKKILKPFIVSNQITVFDGKESVLPKDKVILTSIDHAKGLEYYSVHIIVPKKRNVKLTTQQRARVYTTMTRATDELVIIGI